MIQPTTAPPTMSLTNLMSTEKQGILGETVRGAGQGASPWKSVKFEEELPEGFPSAPPTLREGEWRVSLNSAGHDW